jgi:hypothetical protein
MVSTIIYFTLALDGDELSMQRPGHFTRGKTRYPRCRRLGVPYASLDEWGKLAHTVIRTPDRPVSSESL